jgi:MFS family permease
VAPIASESGFAVRGLWRDPLAWQVTLFMGLQSALAYSVMGWLAPILRERGLSGETAGYVVSLSVIVQVVTCLGVPALAVRARNQRGLAVGVAVLIVAAMLGCQFAPIDQIWGWAVLLGIAQGGAFALALTLIVLRSRDSHVAAQLSGMAQGVGYLVAAFGPLLVGLLRGWTGNFDAAVEGRLPRDDYHDVLSGAGGDDFLVGGLTHLVRAIRAGERVVRPCLVRADDQADIGGCQRHVATHRARSLDRRHGPSFRKQDFLWRSRRVVSRQEGGSS